MNEAKDTSYIYPNFSLAPSFKELLENYKKYNYLTRFFDDSKTITLEDVLRRKTLFVLAEPGQGKTRLLIELSKQNEGQSVFVDLKSKSRDESIASLINRTSVDPIDGANPPLILLDALDEVSPKDVIATIDHIKTYINANPSYRVFISCRVHFFTKYEYSISGLNQAEFLLIEALETWQAKQFLQELGVDRPTVTTIFESIEFAGREAPTVLHTPRYLEMLAEYIKDNPSKIKSLNRADLFEAFVTKALSIEDSKNGRQLALYKKRFLEKLALVMEIAQVNSISEDDLLTFIDEAKSDLKMALINQIDIEDLYEHSLLKKTEQEVSFTNAEIQEYLAAKGILRLNDPMRTVFDVAIEPNIREPLPSWSNTLSFIIDEIPTLAIKLLNIKSKTPISEDETWHRLVTGSTSPSLSNNDKKQIFTRIWNYYFERKQYISGEMSLRLAGYAPIDAVKRIIKDLSNLKLNPATLERAVNILRITGDLIALDKISTAELVLVKRKLVNLSLKSRNKVIQHNAINALRDCKDTSLIDKLFELITDEDDLVQNSLQSLAYEIDKNHPKSVEIFIEGIKRGRANYSHMGVEDIDKPEALSVFLEIFSKDKLLIEEIIKNDRFFVKDDHKLLNNISKHWQKSWIDYLKSFVINAAQAESGYYAERSNLVTDIVKLIASKDNNYFNELMKRVASNDDEGLHFLFTMSQKLAAIMTINDILCVKNIMENNERLKPFVFSYVLTRLGSSGNANTERIEEWTTKEYSDLYRDRAIQTAEYEKRYKKDDLTEVFSNNVLLSQDKDKIVSANAVLKAMESLEENISDQSTDKDEIKYSEEQIEIIWTKAKKIFLDPFNPAATELTINNRNDKQNRNYTITRSNPWFQLAVKFGYSTKRQDLAIYRKKLINLIPYAHYGEMRAVLSILGDLTDDEKDLAIKAYVDHTSDTALLMPENFIEVTEKFLIKSAVPILDKFIEFDQLRDDIRMRALVLSDLLSPDLKKLKQIFTLYKDGTVVQKGLALKANELMITRHNNRSAILWRLEYVESNSFEYVETKKEFHVVGVLEDEIHEGHIVKPLKNISDEGYISNFLDLLNFSFRVFEKGVAWHSYASYIWALIDQYFINLVATGTYAPINKLENCVASYPNQDTVSSYIRHLSSVKRSYLDSLGKPKSFTACIMKLNELSSKNYLPITSNKHLNEIVIEIIQGDLSKWATGEGYKLLPINDEVAAQRSLLIKFDNLFLRKGFTKMNARDEILILRESQAEDDTRTDFLIYYGFYGPTLIELKRSSHPDLKGKKLKTKSSYKSLEKYMRQFRAEFGVLLVYETIKRTEDEWREHLSVIRSEYVTIPGVSVHGIGSSASSES